MISDAIIDVWEHEPEINRELLEKHLSEPPTLQVTLRWKSKRHTYVTGCHCKFFQIEGDYEINAPAPPPLLFMQKTTKKHPPNI